MSITVAVTGLNAVDSPGPGVPVLRCLQESDLDLRLIGLAYDVLEPGNFMNTLIESSYVVPYPSAGPRALQDRILEISAKQKIDIVMPTLDLELDNYIEVTAYLAKNHIKVITPDKDGLDLRNKAHLVDGLEGTDVLLPKTVVLGDSIALQQAEEELNYPFLIKGAYYDAHLASNHDEALGYFHEISVRWGLPVIAQECIIGEEQNVAAFSIDGETHGAVAMKKMFLTDKGKAWAGVTISNKNILDISDRILQHLKWNGGCELEYIVENKTDRVYLIEINPRFPAWIYLGKAAGLNLPGLALRHALGESIQIKNDYQAGVVFVRHSWDEIIPMQDIGALSATGELIHQK